MIKGFSENPANQGSDTAANNSDSSPRVTDDTSGTTDMTAAVSSRVAPQDQSDLELLIAATGRRLTADYAQEMRRFDESLAAFRESCKEEPKSDLDKQAGSILDELDNASQSIEILRGIVKGIQEMLSRQQKHAETFSPEAPPLVATLVIPKIRNHSDREYAVVLEGIEEVLILKDMLPDNQKSVILKTRSVPHLLRSISHLLDLKSEWCI